MSEFQYYDFRSIDKPLTDSERREINGWSSRSNASSHRATFNYSYGSFGKDPKDCVARYFASAFDIAVSALENLHDVAVFQDKIKGFLEKLYDIEERYGRSKALMDRMKRAELPLKGVK